MSPHKKLLKAIQNLFREMVQIAKAVTKKLMNWLLRSILVTGNKANLANAGFILPTVTMVILVVILLTTAMVFRSFERSKNASNVRVDRVVLEAATPALERAKAKIDELFADPTLPRGTPAESALYGAFAGPGKLKRYTFNDEEPVKLVADFLKNDGKYGNDGSINKSTANANIKLENDETLATAWRFPIDTDNNGKYDSYTLYGIFFRSPTQSGGKFDRPRGPLEARTPPMNTAGTGGQCEQAGDSSASLVGNSGWYSINGQLKKSFFVYSATVPIPATPAPTDPTKYEPYKGNKGFSALEYQQDRSRIPISNNAVVFEDDLEITPGPEFRLNGRVVTNSNLLTGETDNNISLYQVSSKDSCYYQEESSKIIVGGNVALGGIAAGSNKGAVNVHLFQGIRNNPTTNQAINSTNQSTSNAPTLVGYNTQAYAERIALLVDAQFDNARTTDPPDVDRKVKAVPDGEQDKERRKQLELWFRNRTRRVPFSEVPYTGQPGAGTTGYSKANVLGGTSLDGLAPPDKWMYPTSTADGKTGTDTKLTLKINQLEATEPEKQQEDKEENYLGDRILVGNNLPAVWKKGTTFVGENEPQEITGASWKDGGGTRYRTTQVRELVNLGTINRDDLWEKAAAEKPVTPLDNVGGLRVITGAGVYERKNSFLPPPTYDNPNTSQVEKLLTYDDPATGVVEQYPIVWPDTMPMSPGRAGTKVFDNSPAIGTAPGWIPLPAELLSTFNLNLNPGTIANTIDPNTPKFAKGDLRMRATAVYHYAVDNFDVAAPAQYQAPIACVSSYYDPTNSVTARNPSGLPDVSGEQLGTPPTDLQGARSNNGVVYGPPNANAQTVAGALPNPGTGLLPGNAASAGLQARINHQANLKFPNGRFVNEPLRNALIRKGKGETLTLSEQSAIDSTVCALQILSGTINPNPALIPHGAIKEVAFLDARQIKAVETDNPVTTALETFTNDGNAQLTGNYNILPPPPGSPPATTATALSVEQRQPLEVRATVLDINRLRTKTISGANVLATPEYLLPNSGIIYASRDDALLDLSNKDPRYLGTDDIESRKQLSANDFQLDPTRRPNGIVLTNGSALWRDQNFREAEKGLILATDLPTYIWGEFNKHSNEEFGTLLTPNWNNFYARSNINDNFACRPQDPRLPKCTTGDYWRPATILADSITLLSKSDNDLNPINDNPALGFRFGYRNEGDYNLSNNQGDRDSLNKRLKNGFWDNNFVTNGLSSGSLPVTVGGSTFTDASYSGNNATAPNSSYFNNFVTPVQRRVNRAPEYVMEICRKLPVSECTADDWVVGFDVNGDGDFYQDTVAPPGVITDAEYDKVDLDGDGTPETKEIDIKTYQLGKAFAVAGKAPTLPWTTPFQTTGGGNRNVVDRLGAGTTARSSIIKPLTLNIQQLIPVDQGYARRVAFARNQLGELVFTEIGANTAAKPLGVGCPVDPTGNAPENNGCQYGGNAPGTNIGLPANNGNGLWFRTTNNVAGNPGTPTDITYVNARPLYYETDPTKYVEELVLPNTPDIAGRSLNAVAPTIGASDYAVCTNGAGGGRTSRKYSINLAAAITPGACPANAQIEAFRAALAALTPDWIANGTGTTNNPDTWNGQKDLILNSNDPVYNDKGDGIFVYELPVTTATISRIGSPVPPATPLTITLKGTPDSIFVLKTPLNRRMDLGLNGGKRIELKLDGVDANKVFWVSNRGIRFNAVSGSHRLAGNFLGSNAAGPANALFISNPTQILGGRFLGFSGSNLPAALGAGNLKMTAMTSQEQPLLVPVLQVQYTDSTPSATLNNPGTRVGETRWMMKANPTTFNLVAATGDTPTRVNPATGLAEINGGLHNFVRFLENWTDNSGTADIAARISGSFIQLKRSNFATAPFDTVASDAVGGIFGYRQAYATDNLSVTPGSNWGKLPYYKPPLRQWGFDVGLLSQLPDLFAQRFTLPETSSPDEFFRQVGRDDPWVKALLCGAVGAQNGNTYTYNRFAANDGSDTNKPDASCRNLGDYQ
ncbi:hormogonium polysaccharide biosynthesis protein HpsA [Funiculus sociatus GB2-A5]|uniref:Hormogonium polysaccharide biosynthesis protein HpsA n=1 Tax=Funiculus sociatus GB2-A5 TaxID=2933946 RepID=A0ABV0JJL6_9CYAN|nr:hormogonium polysaccharide biosynthesis protein HpsA [Trichocoleus sp. FACHB-6]MBD2064338.1 hypothetical protein [Trichocoleus sp. FACHB-6]